MLYSYGPQLIALLTSIFAITLGTRLALRKERRQLLWSKEFERLFALEELAGKLVEELGSYSMVNQPNVGAWLEEFRQTPGRFARYPAIRQSTRDLQNTIDRMFVAKRDYLDEQQELRSELELKLNHLLSACDDVTRRKRLT